jgi:hypothetical protein
MYKAVAVPFAAVVGVHAIFDAANLDIAEGLDLG